MNFADDRFKMVLYDTKCPLCKHEGVDENEEPCESCISEFVNRCSHTPTKFEEKENFR